MEPWIFMCLSWFSVSGTTCLESLHIFSTFCRLEKEATGPEQGLYTTAHTHFCSSPVTWVDLFSLTLAHLHMCLLQSVFNTQFQLHLIQKSAQNHWSSLIVDICVLIRALHLLLLMFCLCEMCACWRKTMSATMIRWRGITTQMQRVYQLKHLVPSECEWAVDLSVTPLQRSFREMNGANAQRGADTARLTDFYHHKWNLFRYL